MVERLTAIRQQAENLGAWSTLGERGTHETLQVDVEENFRPGSKFAVYSLGQGSETDVYTIYFACFLREVEGIQFDFRVLNEREVKICGQTVQFQGIEALVRTILVSIPQWLPPFSRADFSDYTAVPLAFIQHRQELMGCIRDGRQS